MRASAPASPGATATAPAASTCGGTASRKCLLILVYLKGDEFMLVLVTGSSGLIGSEAVQHFDAAGHTVHGIDNNMRREFFGPQGDTTWNLQRLLRETRSF